MQENDQYDREALKDEIAKAISSISPKYSERYMSYCALYFLICENSADIHYKHLSNADLRRSLREEIEAGYSDELKNVAVSNGIGLFLYRVFAAISLVLLTLIIRENLDDTTRIIGIFAGILLFVTIGYFIRWFQRPVANFFIRLMKKLKGGST